MLLTSGLLFALSFIVNKFFQRMKPSGETASMFYLFIGKAFASALFFLCVVFEGNVCYAFGNKYTVLTGILQTLLNIVIMLFGIKVLSVVSVSLHTTFLMIGGMALPVLFGTIFLQEEITVLRLIAFIAITASIIISATGEKQKITVKAVAYLLIIFAANGAIGILTLIHSNLSGKDISFNSYMFSTSFICTALTLPACFLLKKREERSIPKIYLFSPVGKSFSTKKELIFYYISPALSGILNGLANLLIVTGTATEGIGATATYPLSTGGTILFTSLLSLVLYKEKLELKKIIGLVLIILALIAFL